MNNIVYIVRTSSNVCGNTVVGDILGVYDCEEDAMQRIADDLDTDMQYCEYLEKLKYWETIDKDDNKLSEGDPFPENGVKYFHAYDDEQFPEYELEYWYEEHYIS